MVGKNDDMRVKSEVFFKFFTQFIDDIHKILPKPEKKKKAAGLGKGKMVSKVNLQAQMMREA